VCVCVLEKDEKRKRCARSLCVFWEGKKREKKKEIIFLPFLTKFNFYSSQNPHTHISRILFCFFFSSKPFSPPPLSVSPCPPPSQFVSPPFPFFFFFSRKLVFIVGEFRVCMDASMSVCVCEWSKKSSVCVCNYLVFLFCLFFFSFQNILFFCT